MLRRCKDALTPESGTGLGALIGARRLFASAVALGAASLAGLHATAALAASATSELAVGATATGAAAGLSTLSLTDIVGRILYSFFGLLGIIAVCLILYAGFLWMTAQGNEEQIKRAKGVLANAVIGLGIITSAFSITYFILNALGASGLGGGGFFSGGGGPGVDFGAYIGGRRGTSLGNGIIEYHYPEPGQTDVSRSTRISISFKQPLVLSTVFRNYDDKGTYAVADDTVNGQPVTAASVLELNTANVKIIPNASLAGQGSGSIDDQFNRRYPDAGALVSPAPKATVTPVTTAFSAPQMQVLGIQPPPYLGSPTSDVNYRVALRGGVTGVKVWSETSGGTPIDESAFPVATADGGYYWSFTTGTTIDITPPRIAAVIPTATPDPAANEIDRNQLLQIYFDEAVDPATAVGKTGTGGFNLLDVRAKCVSGLPCEAKYAVEAAIEGTFAIGNRYRTVEFTPSAPCENVTENSCGEPVYCLPKNVTIEVSAKAASVGSEPPASSANNGVVDMSGNSLDGNEDGAAQGPVSGPRPLRYDLNVPQANLANVSDSVKWVFRIGENIDLEVPLLRKLDPPTGVPPTTDTLYPTGPSVVPVDQPIVMTWSKVMSVTSMRTGSFDETAGTYRDPYSTIVLRSRECAKKGSAACTATSCECALLDAPSFYLGGLPDDTPKPNTMLVPNPTGAGEVSRVAMLHPVTPFLTGNALGYTKEDLDAYPANIPKYIPIARAKLKDVKQNCFFPSRYEPSSAAGSECALVNGQNSCCMKQGVEDGQFNSRCKP